MKTFIIVVVLGALSACATAPSEHTTTASSDLCTADDPDCGAPGSNPIMDARDIAFTAVQDYANVYDDNGVACGGSADDGWCIMEYSGITYQCQTRTDSVYHCDSNGQNCVQNSQTTCWSTQSPG